MSIYLVCEGPPNGLDNRLLDLLVVNKFNKSVQIVPAGGDKSLGSVAHWLRTQSPSNKVYSIEDRNFRPDTIVQQSWRSTSKRFIWPRHEIENYLLDPRIIAHMFRTWQAQFIPNAQSLPTTDTNVLTMLQSFGQDLLDDYTIKTICYDLYKNISFACARLPSTTRQARLQQINQDGQIFCQTCQDVGDNYFNPQKTSVYETTEIERAYNSILQRLHQSLFIAQGTFLRAMGGHELFSAFQKYLINRGIHISKTDLEQDLLNALDNLYQPGFFSPIDDFQELASRI